MLNANETSPESPKKIKSMTAEMKGVIGWDDNLGRPTYHLEGSIGLISGSETTTSPYADMENSFSSLRGKNVDGLFPVDWTSIQKWKG